MNLPVGQRPGRGVAVESEGLCDGYGRGHHDPLEGRVGDVFVRWAALYKKEYRR